jgi:hypothetical protein
MNGYEARVWKLIAAFNTLSDESKNALIERMETLKQAENAVSQMRNENPPYMSFADNSFAATEKVR